MSDARQPEIQQHVGRTLRTLELLAQGPRTRAELSAALDAHPRTIRRLLDRLVADGYVAVAADGVHFEATVKVVALAGGLLERMDIVRIAFPFVTRLRNEVHEASHLSVPVDHAVMHLLQETAESVVMVKPRIGELVPCHATAVGKALLAHRPGDWDWLRSATLERLTPYTLVDPGDLLVDLARTRERGYAIDDRENSLDLRCVAAPVFDVSARVIAALGISAPSSRLGADRLDEVGEKVREVATALSEALGFDPSASGAARGESWARTEFAMGARLTDLGGDFA